LIKEDVILGEGVAIHPPQLVNLYGCTIGNHAKISTWVLSLPMSLGLTLFGFKIL